MKVYYGVIAVELAIIWILTAAIVMGGTPPLDFLGKWFSVLGFAFGVILGIGGPMAIVTSSERSAA